jgi:hypothetical protein
MLRRISFVGIGLAVAWLTVHRAAADPTSVQRSFKPGELQALLARIESSPELRQAAAAKTDSRLYFASAAKYEIQEDKGALREIAQVLYFKYEGGVTIRVTWDLQAGKVINLETLEAYPTPLAAEEQAAAIQLAREKNDLIRQRFGTTKAKDIEIEVLNTVISNPEDPRYGHRMVLLTFSHKKGKPTTVTVEVDLTQKTVSLVANG